MKHLLTPSLAFYLYLTMYFTGSLVNLEASPFFYESVQKEEDQDLTYMYTTLNVITKIRRDIEDLVDEEFQDQADRQDFLFEIMVILVGTYEKIVNATVTYYLMTNLSMQSNLREEVAKIIAQDAIKIINILGRQLVLFFSHQDLTLKEKIWYCISIATIIGIIKIGIDGIPTAENDQVVLDPSKKANIFDKI